jgi:hypothetical protein
MSIKVEDGGKASFIACTMSIREGGEGRAGSEIDVGFDR